MQNQNSKKIILTEAQEQKIIFRWIRSNQVEFPVLQLAYSTLNGVRLAPKLRKDMKEQGMRPGVPDIVLPAANNTHHGLYIELKREKGGAISAEQKHFMAMLKAEGYLCVVCKGHKEAIKTILDFISKRSNNNEVGRLCN
jgi:hypothetical protein